jgi:predicted amidophosphoribosyltransferase
VPQVGLSATDRRANVAGAFTLASPAVAARLAGKRILLVDDVTTTGSTLDAAASALLAAQSAAIYGIAVTRPNLDDEFDVLATGVRSSGRQSRRL